MIEGNGYDFGPWGFRAFLFVNGAFMILRSCRRRLTRGWMLYDVVFVYNWIVMGAEAFVGVVRGGGGGVWSLVV